MKWFSSLLNWAPNGPCCSCNSSFPRPLCATGWMIILIHLGKKFLQDPPQEYYMVKTCPECGSHWPGQSFKWTPSRFCALKHLPTHSWHFQEYATQPPDYPTVEIWLWWAAAKQEAVAPVSLFLSGLGYLYDQSAGRAWGVHKTQLAQQNHSVQKVEQDLTGSTQESSLDKF